MPRHGPGRAVAAGPNAPPPGGRRPDQHQPPGGTLRGMAGVSRRAPGPDQQGRKPGPSAVSVHIGHHRLSLIHISIASGSPATATRTPAATFAKSSCSPGG